MSEKKLNTTTLKEQLVAGDEKAFSSLINTYHHRLCAYAYSFTKDNAQAKDIVQNVFIKIWEKRKNIASIQSLKSFLYRCTYNECIDQSRKKRELKTIEVEHFNILDKLIQQENDTLLKRKIIAIKNEIENLPPRCKETFLLSKESGLTNEEIANVMGVTTKTVEKQITKAFRVLKQKLGEKYNTLLFLFFKPEIYR